MPHIGCHRQIVGGTPDRRRPQWNHRLLSTTVARQVVVPEVAREVAVERVMVEGEMVVEAVEAAAET